MVDLGTFFEFELERVLQLKCFALELVEVPSEWNLRGLGAAVELLDEVVEDLLKLLSLHVVDVLKKGQFFHFEFNSESSKTI